ncbi:MAG TPA: hypothetical protein VHL56_10620 [Candidatus Limnocylindrales bacterium]|nr:hypothetical protein [Candidatus Limnocylindrales bacterium]
MSVPERCLRDRRLDVVSQRRPGIRVEAEREIGAEAATDTEACLERRFRIACLDLAQEARIDPGRTGQLRAGHAGVGAQALYLEAERDQHATQLRGNGAGAFDATHLRKEADGALRRLIPRSIRIVRSNRKSA